MARRQTFARRVTLGPSTRLLNAFSGANTPQGTGVEDHDDLIARYDYPIIAIPERSGIVFDGKTLAVIGFESVAIFDHASKTVLVPNEGHRIDSSGRVRLGQ